MRYSEYDEAKSAVKCAKWFTILSSLLLCLCGLVLFLWPGTSMSVICNLLGILMLVFGLSKLIGYFFNVSYHLAFQFDLALGLFALLFGILFLVHPGVILSIIWLLVGVYEIVEGVFKMQTALDAGRYHLSGWWFLMLSAVVCVLFGVFLTFNPSKGGALFVQVTGISLLFVGIENMVFTFYAAKRLKDIRRQLHDAWLDENIID